MNFTKGSHKKPWVSLRGHFRSYILAQINTSYDFNSNFPSSLPRFRDITAFVLRIPNMYIPTLQPEIRACSPRIRLILLGAAESKESNPAITYNYFLTTYKSIWAQYLNVTDRRTDGQTINAIGWDRSNRWVATCKTQQYLDRANSAITK